MRLTFKIFLLLYFPLFGLGGQFLVIPYDAKELGLGSQPTIGGFSSLNPALYSAKEGNPSLNISQGNWIGGVSLSSADYSHHLKNKILYLGLRYSGLSDLEFRVNKPQNEPLAKFSSYGLSLKSGVAFSAKNIQYGFSFSYISMGIYTESSHGFSLGLGSLINLKNNWDVGISAQGLGSMSPLLNDSPSIPQRFFIGVSKLNSIGFLNNSSFLSFELNNFNKKLNYLWNVGNKITWKQLEFFNGVSFGKNTNFYSAGLTLKGKNLDISYGIKINAQNLGMPQIISLRLDLP